MLVTGSWGFESVSKGDKVFRDLVLARIIEPTSKIDAAQVLEEVGVDAASYATVIRRLPTYAQPGWHIRDLSRCAGYRCHPRHGAAQGREEPDTVANCEELE